MSECEAVAIIEYLNEQSIPFWSEPNPADAISRSACSAVVCYLEDKLGGVQAVFPSTHIMSLANLNLALSRELKPVAAYRMGNGRLPLTPKMQGFINAVDPAMLEFRHIFIDAANAGTTPILDSHSAKMLFSSFQKVRFSSPCKAVIELPLLQAEAPITDAVSAFTTRRIKARLSETLDIPPLPITVKRITEFQVDINASAAGLTKIVEQDPPLAAQVVAWAASPYYGIKGGVSSVQDAITRALGFDIVMNLAIGLALSSSLNTPPSAHKFIERNWKASVYTAVLASRLAKIAPSQKAQEGVAYLAGLLHNFGAMVIAHIFSEHLKNMIESMEVNGHLSFRTISRSILGVDDGVIGGWLLNHWGMPDEVNKAVSSYSCAYERPEASTYGLLISTALSALDEAGIVSPQEQLPLDLLCSLLEISREDVMAEVEALQQMSKEIDQMARTLCS